MQQARTGEHCRSVISNETTGPFIYRTNFVMEIQNIVKGARFRVYAMPHAEFQDVNVTRLAHHLAHT